MTTPDTAEQTTPGTTTRPATGTPAGTVGAPWGVELVLDLDGCDRERISNRRVIRRFAEALVQEIGMRRYGRPVCKRFALDNPEAAGYSLVQLITTSSITAHFAENTGRAFINVFSCKDFDVDAAAQFIAAYFRAGRYTAQVLHRGPNPATTPTPTPAAAGTDAGAGVEVS
ncbi:S-adenosylmethionine decarboxylase [Dactylosporangium sp. NBC_01737]|uniref:S-adenosylmethionine decarboxylase family protein n=1 Tax=Dactylosporangium sp. NBC_01737 TaxID=2975959 RepID=UPI002E1325B7|nr:S-adenosylmethionine decarboxylase [Dactylosporangium sp. NBC_01737]